MTGALLVSFVSSAAAQRGEKPPVLIPPGQGGGQQEEAPTPRADTPPAPRVVTPDDHHEGDGHDHGHLHVTPAGEQNAAQPRAIPTGLRMPFTTNRVLIQVENASITAADINQMVAYFSTFRGGMNDLNMRDAVRAMLPTKVMASRYADDLPSMRARIDEALRLIREGERSWAEVVAEYSDDAEAENPEGKYTFGREVAVQPFDRFAHTGRVGQIHGPFLTKYGFHFLEILAYERGETAAEDQSTVRHVLVMYPDLRKRADAGEDIRAFIRDQVDAAKIVAVERGLRNLLPPKPTAPQK